MLARDWTHSYDVLVLGRKYSDALNPFILATWGGGTSKQNIDLQYYHLMESFCQMFFLFTHPEVMQHH